MVIYDYKTNSFYVPLDDGSYHKADEKETTYINSQTVPVKFYWDFFNEIKLIPIYKGK